VGNDLDYDAKWREVERLLAEWSVKESATVLDAGCGSGYFTLRLVERGHRVTASDFSSAALEQTRRRCGRRTVRVVHCAVDDLEPDEVGRFDAVFCVDVLFHIVDDERWLASVEALSRVVAPGGLLVVQEHLESEGSRLQSPGNHVRWRTAADYERALGSMPHISSYELPGEQTRKDLLVWQIGGTP
jgi:2-polyprenyl-3-methyl-5-hydroxy-6-metoxy-1,4-benzoquinol methylase